MPRWPDISKVTGSPPASSGDQRANFVAVFLKLGRIRDLMLHNQISRQFELQTVAAYPSLRLIHRAEK